MNHIKKWYERRRGVVDAYQWWGRAQSKDPDVSLFQQKMLP